jgi:hypothetical protein
MTWAPNEWGASFNNGDINNLVTTGDPIVFGADIYFPLQCIRYDASLPIGQQYKADIYIAKYSGTNWSALMSFSAIDWLSSGRMVTVTNNFFNGYPSLSVSSTGEMSVSYRVSPNSGSPSGGVLQVFTNSIASPTVWTRILDPGVISATTGLASVSFLEGVTPIAHDLSDDLYLGIRDASVSGKLTILKYDLSGGTWFLYGTQGISNADPSVYFSLKNIGGDICVAYEDSLLGAFNPFASVQRFVGGGSFYNQYFTFTYSNGLEIGVTGPVNSIPLLISEILLLFPPSQYTLTTNQSVSSNGENCLSFSIEPLDVDGLPTPIAFNYYVTTSGIFELSEVASAVPIPDSGPNNIIGSYNILNDLFVVSTPNNRSIYSENIYSSLQIITTQYGLSIHIDKGSDLVSGGYVILSNDNNDLNLSGNFLCHIDTSSSVDIVYLLGYFPLNLFSSSCSISMTHIGVGNIGVAVRDENDDSWNYTRLLRHDLSLSTLNQVDMFAEINNRGKSLYITDNNNPVRSFQYYGDYITDNGNFITIGGNTMIIGTAGVLRVGTQSVDSNDRFIVSSYGGTISLVVDEYGNTYNKSRGLSNTLFGYNVLRVNVGASNSAFGYSSLSSNTTGYNNSSFGNNSLVSNISGYENTAIGGTSLYSNTTGFRNTAIGLSSLYSNTTGTDNTAIGNNSLKFNTTGFDNTAIGYGSLYSNKIGLENISIGNYSLYTSTQSYYNTAIGVYSLYNNITGQDNIAIGNSSLFSNISGSNNTAVGNGTLLSNTTGNNNTAIGLESLYLNTTGYNNTTTGFSTLRKNTSGSFNTAIGNSSLFSNTSGSNNTALGNGSLYSNTFGYRNTALGNGSLYSNTNGFQNIAVGYNTLFSNTNGYKNIGIGELSLYSNIDGWRNIAMGEQTLYSNTNGWSNVGIGQSVLQYSTTSDRNIGIGTRTMKYYKGIWSLAMGDSALFRASTGILQLTATFSSGSGYNPGTYSNVRLYYKSGTLWSSPGGDVDGYPTVSIVVGPGGTVSSVTLKDRGVLIPDTTTRFQVQTGTYSYQLGTASGTGFEIGINTIATANLNIALGHGSLYRLGVGSDNIAIGMWAGIYYGNDEDLTGSDGSIFIGRYTKSLLNDCVNEIVIGNGAIGNGSNTVTLGNNDVLKTYLKGKVVIADGSQGNGKVLTSDTDGMASWSTIGGTGSFYIKGGSTYSYDTTSDIYRTGAILIGTGSVDSNDRFVVSSLSGTVSLVVDESGNVYNRGKGSVSSNTVFGYQSLYSNTVGYFNSAFGVQSLLSNTTGNQNSAFGLSSLRDNTTNVSSLSILNAGSGYTINTTFSNVQLSYISGSKALTYPIVTIYVGSGGTVSNITLENPGTGFIDSTTIMGSNLGGLGSTFSVSINGLVSGNNNSAFGYGSLLFNTTGNQNSAFGVESLFYNTKGNFNSAFGVNSLKSNTTGSFNVAIGNNAIGFNLSGAYNVAIGQNSLYRNETGNNNTTIGDSTLYFNTIGSDNIALGSSAGNYDINSTGVTNSNTSIFIGINTRPQLDNQTNQIVIGHGATGSGSNSVTLGSDTITRTYLKGSLQLPIVPTTSVGTYSILTRNDITGEVEKIPIQSNPITGTGSVNQIAYFSGTSSVFSLDTNTYPSLSELSYVKGITSSIQTQLNILNVNNIIISTTASITTNTNDSSGYGQDGRNVMISNGASVINLSCETTSAPNFVASYTKLGASAITFVAGSGTTLVLVDGSAILNGVVGSTACLTRTGNTFYLQISNR